MKVGKSPSLLRTVCAASMPLLCQSPAVGAAELAAAGKVAAVTVYGDRAWVTRSAPAVLPAGETQVVFDDLPAGIQEDSLSASVRSGPARILGLELRRKYSAQPRDEKLRALQREVELLGDQAREVSNRVETYRKQLDFADKVQISQVEKVSKELALRDAKPGEWDSVLKFLERARLGGFSSMLKAEAESRDLQRALQAKQQQLSALASSHPSVSASAVVRVASKQGAESVLELRYVLTGASWQPSYDARADLSAGEIELTYLGTVRQRTGEDWREVRMSLSTARPGSGAHMASLSPMILSPQAIFGLVGDRRMVARQAKGRALASGRMYNGIEQGNRAGGPPMARPAPSPPGGPSYPGPESDEFEEPDSGWETAEANAGGSTALYHLAGAQSVPSGDRPQRTVIASSRFKAALSYVAAPKLQPFAFLKAAARNTGENHLLPGPVNAFVGGDFLGQSRLEAIAPQQEFNLHLGIDERMKVKRELLVDKTRDSFWGKKLVLSQGYRITVENYTGAARSVAVFDQRPVSRDEQIQVRAFRAEPEPAEVKEQTGELEWRLELQPGEKRAIEFSYEIVFPEEIASQPGSVDKLRLMQRAF